MTVGIVASGPSAGLAIFTALATIEAVGRGAIGGFASFAAIGGDGVLRRAETQRGGSGTLFTAGGRMASGPPPEIAGSPLAALMSSGPDRPTPLSQFVAAAAGTGLVSGHRFANMPGLDGVPLNLCVLNRMGSGETPEAAVTSEIERNADADAGLIAVDAAGRIALGNTRFVAGRVDLGTALVQDPASGLTVAVLHNSILPYRGLAELAASAAIDAVAPLDRADLVVELRSGTRIETGPENCLHLDGDGRVTHVTVTQPDWLTGRKDGAVLIYGAQVRQSGVAIGRVSFEPYCVADSGRLLSMSGQESIGIGVRRAGGTGG